MKHNDDDIKIFHPSKKEGAGADLAELALLMDTAVTAIWKRQKCLVKSLQIFLLRISAQGMR